MKEQLISLETAKLALKAGYMPGYTMSAYNYQTEELVNNNIGHSGNFFSAPPQSVLQKWLREVHNINVESNYLPNIQKYRCLYVPMTKVIPNKEKYAFRSKYYGTDNFDTYEEALESGLQEALKLIG